MEFTMISSDGASILLADDHAVVRAGVREALEQRAGWHVCGEAGDGRDAVRMTLDLAPDVLVLDISIPRQNGVQVARDLRRRQSRTEILMFTMHDSEQLVRETLAAGARGYVLKSAPTADLLRGVESLLNHKPYFCPRISETVLRGSQPSPPDEMIAHGAEDLTGRELLVVQMLAESRSNKVIARDLGISVKTVETHRANIMRKLGARSLADLVRYAVRNSLVEP
jgi:DNA-binding NarL/FixJ family response regulator